MLHQLKKYGALFLLLLFLFPVVEKQLHIYEHSADEHCYASDKHFHEMEHTCSICEFTLIDTLLLSNKFIPFVNTEYPHYFHMLNVRVNGNTTFSDLPSRAPPRC